MRELLNEPFLPYTADELLPHFVNYDAEGENPEKYLTKWRERIAKAPSKDPDWLERDETFLDSQCAGGHSSKGRLRGPLAGDYVEAVRANFPPQLSVWSGATLYGPI